MKKIVFDLDNTLIDSEIVKDYLYDLSLAYGYDLATAKDIYKTARNNSKGNLNLISFESYSDELKRRLLGEGKQFDANISKKYLKGLKKMKDNILIPGATEILNYCKDREMDMYLLSLGVPDWQKFKIKFTGLNKYFSKDKIILTQYEGEGKKESLKKMFGDNFDGSGMVVVNDKPDETFELLNNFPKLSAYQIIFEKEKRYSEKDYEKLCKKFTEDRLICAPNLHIIFEIFKSVN